MKKVNGIYVLGADSIDLIYGPEERRDIAGLVDIIAEPQTKESVRARPDLLGNVDVILSGWGGPRLDQEFLAATPKLKAFFYGGGSLSSVLSEQVWKRGIVVTSAIAANATPVAEYTLGAILFSLKHGWQLSRITRERRTYVDRNGAPGCYGSTVGLISLGATGRTVLDLLSPFMINVLVYDPFLSDDDADSLGVEHVSLQELFERSDVVSLHAPCLTETEGMITGRHLEAMKPGATFINTARGVIVREDELLEVASRRPDLQFILDVVCAEPPEADSPFYTLPNIVLTPHIAGSAGKECRRMGRFMVEELRRFLAGERLKWGVTLEMTLHTSHRPVNTDSPPIPEKVTVQTSTFVHAPRPRTVTT